MIFISYGIPKSASSFVFQLTHRILESLDQAGQVKLRMPNDVLPDIAPVEFAESLIAGMIGNPNFRESGDRAAVQMQLDSLFERLDEQVSTEDDVAIILKTHLPCSPSVERAIREGRVLASATFRHPAEMLLSMDDMEERGAATMPDKKKVYRELVNDFYSWAAIPGVRKYYYDDIATAPEFIAKDIINHLGATADESEILQEFLRKKKEAIWEFNKGVTERHLDEMAPKEIKKMEAFFCDYIAYIQRHVDIVKLRMKIGDAAS